MTEPPGATPTTQAGQDEPEKIAEQPGSPTAYSEAPRPNTKTTTNSVAITAAFSLSESRKYNFDVTGAASIEATLVSVPPPSGLVDFLNEALKGKGKS